MNRRAPALLAALVLAACGSTSSSAAPSPQVTPSPAAPSPTPSGPGGLTLDEEIGTVMIVGFTGAATADVLADWRVRHFGGLLIVARNANGADRAQISSVIAAVRATESGPILVATDQEGGQICLAATGAYCGPWPADAAAQGAAAVREQAKQMACGIKQAGFNTDLAPVVDVVRGPGDVIGARSYGSAPGPVGADAAAAVQGVHDCGLVSVIKHFPGLGNVTQDPETTLPTNGETLGEFQTVDWPPYRDALAAGADMVMVSHELAPALDPLRPSSVSPATIALIRSDLGFQGPVMSDDMQMGALRSGYSAPQAALDFLEAGGDMVMIAHDLQVADQTYDLIRQAVLSGAYPRAALDVSVSRVLGVLARVPG